MRAIWKGYLKFSLVTIPIKMYRAISGKPLQFHLYHQECGSQIRQEIVCPVCDKTLASDEVERGYQYGKDLHVVLTEEDFQKAQKETTDTMEVLKFIQEEQLNPIYYADSHYLVPDGQAGAEAFALLRQAMGETNKTALARAVMRNREHLYNLRPYNGTLIAFTLHYPEEILEVKEVEEGEGLGKTAVSRDNLEMAKLIIQNLSGDFLPQEYPDEYTRTLRQIIQAKAEGREIQVEPREEQAKVVNLMEALKKSVEETKKEVGAPRKGMAKAGGRGQAPGRRRKKVDAG